MFYHYLDIFFLVGFAELYLYGLIYSMRCCISNSHRFDRGQYLQLVIFVETIIKFWRRSEYTDSYL